MPQTASPHSKAVTLTVRAIELAQKDGIVPDPRPLSRADLDALEVGLGCALPPSLRCWLSFDTSYLAKTVGWFEGNRPIPALPMAELAKNHAGPLAKVHAPLIAVRFPGNVVALDSGSDSIRFLWFGDPDAEGEYPVLFLDNDDDTVLGVQFPSFAVWLADELGVWSDGVAYNKHKAERQEISLRILGKKGDVSGGGNPKKVTPCVKAPAPGVYAALVMPEIERRKAKKLTDKALLGAIQEGADRGDGGRVSALLADFAGRKLPGAQLCRALLNACSAKHVDVVKQLLAAGASANAADATYGSALAQACWGWADAGPRILEVVELLLSAGADPNGPYMTGTTVLHHAVASAPLAVVTWLLEAGADPSRRRDEGVPPLVHLARERTAPDVIELLVRRGASIDAPDGEESALHASLAKGRSDNVRTLLALGASPNLADFRGHRPLEIALTAGHFALAADLVRAGARRDVADSAGLTYEQVLGEKGEDVRPVEARCLSRPAPQSLTLTLRHRAHARLKAGSPFLVPGLLIPGVPSAKFELAPAPLTGVWADDGPGVLVGRVVLDVAGLDPYLLVLAARALLGTRPLALSLSIVCSAEGPGAIDGAQLRRSMDDPGLAPPAPATPTRVAIVEKVGPGHVEVASEAPLSDLDRAQVTAALNVWRDALEVRPAPDGAFRGVLADRPYLDGQRATKSKITRDVGAIDRGGDRRGHVSRWVPEMGRGCRPGPSAGRRADDVRRSLTGQSRILARRTRRHGPHRFRSAGGGARERATGPDDIHA